MFTEWFDLFGSKGGSQELCKYFWGTFNSGRKVINLNCPIHRTERTGDKIQSASTYQTGYQVKEVATVTASSVVQEKKRYVEPEVTVIHIVRLDKNPQETQVHHDKNVHGQKVSIIYGQEIFLSL